MVRNGSLPERSIVTGSGPIEVWVPKVRSPTQQAMESAFSAIWRRIDRTKNCLTRTGMVAIVYKLAMAAQTNWRCLRGFQHRAKVIAGVKFNNGVQARRETRTSRRQEVSRVGA